MVDLIDYAGLIQQLESGHPEMFHNTNTKPINNLDKANMELAECRKNPEWVKVVGEKISKSKLGLSSPFEGRVHTEETKKRLSETTSVWQSGARNSQHGTMWITDGEVNSKIKKGDPIPTGWRPGRKCKRKTL